MVRPLRRWLVCVWLAVAVLACRDTSETRPPLVRGAVIDTASPGTLLLPNRPSSVKFAVIGDSGRGNRPQHEVAARMMAFRSMFSFPFVLMLGDNIYEGPATREDYDKKFEEPYRALLNEGVQFYAVLGNHDDPRQVTYPLFNMDGERYYSFAPPEDLLARIATRVEFFAIDSTNLDRAQLRWLDGRLAASRAAWKVCFMHHPLYTSGRYSTWSRAYRWRLESIFIRHGVDVAFAGHEHIYQRAELQRGVLYFVSGGAGSLRPGDGAPATYVARTFNTDYHFMLIEIDGDRLHFQAIARSGQTVDAGTLHQAGSDARDTGLGPSTRPDTAARH